MEEKEHINVYFSEKYPSPFKKLEKENNIKKIFELSYDDKIYILIISLIKKENENNENIFNFKLKEKFPNFIDRIIYYEIDKEISELAKLFLINLNKFNNPEEIILQKLDKFHSKKNVCLFKSSETNINLIYTIKMVDNDDYEINIDLNKKEEIISNEKAAFLLNKEVNDLKKEIEKLKLNYDKKLKKQEQEINLLKSKIKNISKEKLIIEPLNCHTNPFLLNKYKRINDGIDGGRGVNDLFEIFHLLKDKKVVYLAFKNKSENSQISYIDIMKIISINNYKTIKRLSGHNQRIVYIKYFFDPYSEKEYLVSGDREEKIIV